MTDRRVLRFDVGADGMTPDEFEAWTTAVYEALADMPGVSEADLSGSMTARRAVIDCTVASKPGEGGVSDCSSSPVELVAGVLASHRSVTGREDVSCTGCDWRESYAALGSEIERLAAAFRTHIAEVVVSALREAGHVRADDGETEYGVRITDQWGTWVLPRDDLETAEDEAQYRRCRPGTEAADLVQSWHTPWSPVPSDDRG